MKTSCVCLAVLAVVVAVTATPPPVVDIPTLGAVNGKWTYNGSSEFLAIPFAEPPINELRFASPVPVKPWSTPIDGTNWGHPCIQNPEGYFSLPPDEGKCLNLNVFAPPGIPFGNVTDDDLRPTMVFIYGGSYVSGANSIPIYDASSFAGRHGVVVVTVNYRLGFLGFGGSEALRAGNQPDNSTGNFGLQDQRLAIKWVRSHIRAFGGDGNHVFVWGESAGAGSTSAHLVAPRSAGLFEAAGMESGALAAWIAKPMSESENIYSQMLTATGCATASDSVSCLRGLTSQEILDAQNSITVNWSPVIDGVEFSLHPQNLALAGKWANKVPLLLGSNKDEGTLFNRLGKNISFSAVHDLIVKAVAPGWGQKVLDVYPDSSYASGWDLYSEVFGNQAFNCPTRATARLMTATGNNVFTYFWTHTPSHVLSPNCVGACHASELPFVFDFQFELSPDEDTLGNEMNAYWASFGRDHFPSPLNTPGLDWPVFTKAGDKYLRLDVSPNMGVVSDLLETQCNMWDAYFAANPVPNFMTESESVHKSFSPFHGA